MRIVKRHDAPESARQGEYHILTFAETGFAMLNIYGEAFCIVRDDLQKFSMKANREDESGSLHPKAPISIVPRRYIRDLMDAEKLAGQIIEFLKANQKTIHAKKYFLIFGQGSIRL
ncbi:MAG: hypothetical protein WCI11_15920 [Candidatus Methylumidiphilus sp.]